MKRIFINVVLVTILLLTLTACSTTSSNLEKKMNEKGYSTFNLHEYTNFIKGISPNGVDKYFAFSKGSTEEEALNNAKNTNQYLVVVYYVDKKSAEESYNTIENNDKNITVKLSGKSIYYATSDLLTVFESL